MQFVLDNSVTMRWLFGEQSAAATQVAKEPGKDIASLAGAIAKQSLNGASRRLSTIQHRVHPGTIVEHIVIDRPGKSPRKQPMETEHLLVYPGTELEGAMSEKRESRKYWPSPLPCRS